MKRRKRQQFKEDYEQKPIRKEEKLESVLKIEIERWMKNHELKK